ncbi:MAG TPA: response regulator transcription factor [Desulfobacterales bacterium]|nr:response regulator transcription factor [Desulfobacterales bacterium]
MTEKADILVIEDDPALLGGLMDVLVFNGFAVSGVADGRDGLQAALERPADLVLLDLMLPGLDGLAVCRAIRARRPHQPVIMITARGSEDDIVAGFKAGADDYIPKPFSLRELMVRVEAVLRRAGKNPAGGSVQLGGIRFDAQQLTAEACGRTVEITRREMDLIAYFHRHAGRIVTRGELLTEVWHYVDAGIETRTVDIHMLKLRRKLAELTGEERLIATVRGEGYRLDATA